MASFLVQKWGQIISVNQWMGSTESVNQWMGSTDKDVKQPQACQDFTVQQRSQQMLQQPKEQSKERKR
jgi:hypothetical protein